MEKKPMDKPMHMWWFAGEVIFQREGMESPEVLRLNTPIATTTKFMTADDIAEGNRRLVTVAVKGHKLTMDDIQDVFCYGINYLGLQSWNTFRGRPVGTPAKEEAELANAKPDSLSVEVAKQFRNN